MAVHGSLFALRCALVRNPQNWACAAKRTEANGCAPIRTKAQTSDGFEPRRLRFLNLK